MNQGLFPVLGVFAVYTYLRRAKFHSREELRDGIDRLFTRRKIARRTEEEEAAAEAEQKKYSQFREEPLAQGRAGPDGRRLGT
jgi:hypothetical protein